MDDDSTARVTVNKPSQLMLTVFNPLFGLVLRSPAHRLLDDPFMILHLTGRRTGTPYDIVVGRHELAGVCTVMTSAPWRLNVRGGAEVQVTSDGRTWTGHATLVEAPEPVAAAYAAEVDRIGWKGAQRRLGITTPDGHEPTRQDLLAAVNRVHLSLIEITQQDSG